MEYNIIITLIVIAIINSSFFTVLINSPLHPKLNFKPFNCSNCLSFWSSMIIGYLTFHSVVPSILSAMLAYYGVTIIKTIIRKLN
jgi:hypothetical protein